jgi:hypothetical protein
MKRNIRFSQLFCECGGLQSHMGHYKQCESRATDSKIKTHTDSMVAPSCQEGNSAAVDEP